jgi:hypothetical protein
MKSAFLLILIALVLVSSLCRANVYGAENKKEKEIYKIESLPNDLNLHYTGEYCKVCHEKKTREGGATFLKYGGDYNRLCKCHDNSLGSYIHPVDIVPSEGKRGKIPPDFPLIKGKLSCITCHDLYLQCQETEKETSLRGAPFEKRAQFCFNCHNDKSYVMHDIHNQINEQGELIADKCLSCHHEKPDVDYDRFGDIKLLENIEGVCQGCHAIGPNHAGNYNHMIRPSLKGLKKMKKAELEFGIIFPLDEKGDMTCITCHNPHGKGVISEDKPAAKGAGLKFKHRTTDICAKCHRI